MMRQEYIARLEEIRKQVKKIGAAFAAVDLTDKTGMESDRRKKTTKLVADLCDRLYEDIAISAKVAADNAEAGIGEQGDLFDDAAKTANAKARAEKPAAEEAEVVDVPTIEYKPEAKKPDEEKPADDPKPDKGSGKKSSKGGKGKKPGKKGGTK